jgi:serine/threonine protein kinase
MKYYNFKEKSQLGEGAFGTVYKATSKEDKTFECAIKVLDREEMD